MRGDFIATHPFLRRCLMAEPGAPWCSVVLSGRTMEDRHRGGSELLSGKLFPSENRSAL